MNLNQVLFLYIGLFLLMGVPVRESIAAVPGCAGIPTISISGNTAGTEGTLTVANVAPGETIYLGISAAPDYYPWAHKGHGPGAYLGLSLDPAAAPVFVQLKTPLLVGDIPNIPGATFYIQAFLFNSACAPRGLAFSDTYPFYIKDPAIEEAKVVVANIGAAQNDALVKFGFYFKPGQFLSADQIAVEAVEQGNLALERDIKILATHDGAQQDKSIRHAMITARVPAIAAGETLTLRLVSGQGINPSGGFVELLPNLNASVMITDSAGKLFQSSYQSATRCRLRDDGGFRRKEICWTEAVDANGIPLANLDQRFEIETFSNKSFARVCYSSENTYSRLSLSDSSTTFRNIDFSNYEASVDFDGNGVADTILESAANDKIWDMTAHSRCATVGSAATDFDSLRVYYPNQDYFVNAGLFALPLHNAALPEGDIKNWQKKVTPGFNSTHFVQSDMEITGDRDDIGQEPKWVQFYRQASKQFAYDPAKRYLIDQARDLVFMADETLSGAFQVHVRDNSTGFRADHSFNNPGNPFVPYNLWGTRKSDSLPDYGKDTRGVGATNAPTDADAAHHPAGFILRYMETGDEPWLDSLLMWAAWMPHKKYPETSPYMKFCGRPTAWPYRTFINAIKISQSGTPSYDYMVNLMNLQVDYWAGRTVDSANPHPLFIPDDCWQTSSSGREPTGSSEIHLPDGTIWPADGRSAAFISPWDYSWHGAQWSWMRRANDQWFGDTARRIADFMGRFQADGYQAPKDPLQDFVQGSFRFPADILNIVKYSSYPFYAEKKDQCGVDKKGPAEEVATHGEASLLTYSQRTDKQFQSQGNCYTEPQLNNDQNDWFRYGANLGIASSASNGADPEMRAKALAALDDMVKNRMSNTKPAYYYDSCFYCGSSGDKVGYERARRPLKKQSLIEKLLKRPLSLKKFFDKERRSKQKRPRRPFRPVPSPITPPGGGRAL